MIGVELQILCLVHEGQDVVHGEEAGTEHQRQASGVRLRQRFGGDQPLVESQVHVLAAHAQCPEAADALVDEVGDQARLRFDIDAAILVERRLDDRNDAP